MLDFPVDFLIPKSTADVRVDLAKFPLPKPVDAGPISAIVSAQPVKSVTNTKLIKTFFNFPSFFPQLIYTFAVA